MNKKFLIELKEKIASGLEESYKSGQSESIEVAIESFEKTFEKTGSDSMSRDEIVGCLKGFLKIING